MVLMAPLVYGIDMYFLLCSTHLKLALLLHKQGFVDSQMVTTIFCNHAVQWSLLCLSNVSPIGHKSKGDVRQQEEGGGVKKSKDYCNVVYGWSLRKADTN